MERILIIEDNKTLAKLMAKKISSELGLEVDIAHSLSEAKLFTKKYSYFLILTDLNLPDAPNGEVVDYILEKNSRVIVLSGNIDKEFRRKMLQKNIIDYVNKGGVDDINYIIQSIKRLRKNKNHKILVVDDSIVFRKKMQGMLENMFYKVITVAHGEEAIAMIHSNQDISLVLTDYNMPVMNGLELTREIRKEYCKNDIGIIAISSDSDDETTAMFLKSGANDYIKKPFSKEEFSCRINNSVEALENIQIITNHTNRDFLTGLYNRRYFYESMDIYFKKATQENETFAVAMINIDNFKEISNTFGHDGADSAIISLADILRAHINPDDMVARFNGDELCIVLKNITQSETLEKLEELRASVASHIATTNKSEKIQFTISIGAVLNCEDTLDETINKADMLLYGAKQNGTNQVVYD